MDANDRITRIKKNSIGEYEVQDLEINGKSVPVVSSMTKEGENIIALSINGKAVKVGFNKFYAWDSDEDEDNPPRYFLNIPQTADNLILDDIYILKADSLNDDTEMNVELFNKDESLSDLIIINDDKFSVVKNEVTITFTRQYQPH